MSSKQNIYNKYAILSSEAEGNTGSKQVAGTVYFILYLIDGIA